MYEDNPTTYELALEEMSAWSTAELLYELESCISDLAFREGRARYIHDEFKSLESAQRGSKRFNSHIDNIRRGLKHFDCTDAADRANAILDLLSHEKTKREPIGSWEY